MDKTNFIKFYEGSYYTITGCGGDLEDWKTGYRELLTKAGIGSISEFETFKGKDYNEAFHLTGTNRYPDDLTFLCFPLNGLQVGKLAIFKLQMGDRWFDDIVDNDLRREHIDRGVTSLKDIINGNFNYSIQ